MTFYINVHLNHSLSRREWLLGGERQDAAALLWSLSSLGFLPLAKARNASSLAGVGLAGQSPLASWQERGLRCSGAEVAEVLKVAHLLLPHLTPALVPSILFPPMALAPGSQPAFSPTWPCRPPYPSAHRLKDKFTPFPCKKFIANPYREPAEITKI